MPKPGAIRLDLTRVTIEPFSDRAVVNRFSCGQRPLDSFLKNKAKKAVTRSEHRVFCAFLDGTPNVVGYYALQLGTDSVSELPDASKDNYLKNYVAFPAVNLSFLAVDEQFQRQGLGEYLLMDVFEKAAAIAEHAGYFALTLVSMNDGSTAFYKSLKFRVYSENTKLPKMLYPLEDILTLVRGK
ncbi:MAG: GNAT family N-acetyltransferase [Pseudolabrys sp.]|nr:GNAT family N-acetyltransferase [Pseudolabrys sp.]MDP2293910.1 GNAT family N-acetyltransferase [Pseudolabrys sp.]